MTHFEKCHNLISIFQALSFFKMHLFLCLNKWTKTNLKNNWLSRQFIRTRLRQDTITQHTNTSD